MRTIMNLPCDHYWPYGLTLVHIIEEMLPLDIVRLVWGSVASTQGLELSSGDVLLAHGTQSLQQWNQPSLELAVS